MYLFMSREMVKFRFVCNREEILDILRCPGDPGVAQRGSRQILVVSGGPP